MFCIALRWTSAAMTSYSGVLMSLLLSALSGQDVVHVRIGIGLRPRRHVDRRVGGVDDRRALGRGAGGEAGVVVDRDLLVAALGGQEHRAPLADDVLRVRR